MIKTTTQSDMILYAYNESDLSDSDRIQRSIDGDPVVQQEFAEVLETMKMMDEVQVSPSEESISKIIAFARGCKA
jgi:hypothetical protein